MGGIDMNLLRELRYIWQEAYIKHRYRMWKINQPKNAKLYNAALFNVWAQSGYYNVHRSKKHHDGKD